MGIKARYTLKFPMHTILSVRLFLATNPEEHGIFQIPVWQAIAGASHEYLASGASYPNGR